MVSSYTDAKRHLTFMCWNLEPLAKKMGPFCRSGSLLTRKGAKCEHTLWTLENEFKRVLAELRQLNFNTNQFYFSLHILTWWWSGGGNGDWRVECGSILCNPVPIVNNLQSVENFSDGWWNSFLTTDHKNKFLRIFDPQVSRKRKDKRQRKHKMTN